MYMNELSKAMSLNTSTSTRMIDGLVKEGFVERGYDQSDRRLVTVGLTGKGKKVAKDIKAFRDKYFDLINAKVKDNGKKEMVSSLKTLIDAFGNFKSQL
jgi:DNA-binding MarR family transcriptional regulator